MVPITGVEISQKAKCAETNCHFEKFQNDVNLIYTGYGLLEMLM